MKHYNINPEEVAAHAGLELAHQANEAFDAHGPNSPRFLKISETAGNLIGYGSLGESELRRQAHSETPAVEAKAENPTGLEASRVWGELTPERQEAAKRWAEAVAAMPLFEGRGLTAADFRVVKTHDENEDDTSRYTVMYAATKRLVLGKPGRTFDPARSWNGIKAGKRNSVMMVKQDGKAVDVRTAQVYNRLAAVVAENPEISEGVWEAGAPEKAGGFDAPAVNLLDGRAREGRVYHDGGIDRLGFRPAVDLE